MAEIAIGKEDDGGRHGRYVARIDGVEGEAEITFTKRGAGDDARHRCGGSAGVLHG